MLNLTVAGLMLAAMVPQQAGFQTDTTLAVPAGTRLSLQNMQGDVVIHAWERNQVRVQADHSSRTAINVDLSGSVLRLSPRGREGMRSGGTVDYEITVPSAMALDLDGMGGDVSIEGVRGDIKVRTVEGDIALKGGGGIVTLITINGGITVEGARASRLELRAVSDDIEVADSEGDLVAEAVSGDLWVVGVRARTVDAQTVSGNITFSGTLRAGGSYALSTHSGDITMAVPDGASALFRTATANGDVTATFGLPDPEQHDVTGGGAGRMRGSRKVFRLGDGGASVELDTFSGDVSLVRPGEIPTRSERDF